MENWDADHENAVFSLGAPRPLGACGFTPGGSGSGTPPGRSKGMVVLDLNAVRSLYLSPQRE